MANPVAHSVFTSLGTELTWAVGVERLAELHDCSGPSGRDILPAVVARVFAIGKGFILADTAFVETLRRRFPRRSITVYPRNFNSPAWFSKPGNT